MKTQLRDFCVDYARVSGPLAEALTTALTRVEAHEGARLIGDVHRGLTDVQHRLKILVDKLEGQHAYLLIFGPLKSGKSTLMNAISSTYVSEVSSLPAYPCLAYVRNAETESFAVTAYDGQRRELKSNPELQELVTAEHKHLAENLRAVEQRGQTFDPSVHYPQALRRIDIALPAAELARSGVVLVDTPGLYTKMKFGYDVMTRDFRDTAACAVFVVKTENLFLEQVFAEFNELLKIFSRVFLVVNIDAGKRDLAPDGSLRPSAESSAPQEVVAAFESLSMDAPLREAFDGGRLKIYPIDLMDAASRRLSLPAPPAETDADADEGDAESSEDAPAIQPSGNEAFDAFVGDLSDYLNSSDYLAEFKRDSVHQGELLAGELKDACTGASANQLRAALDDARQRLDDANARLEAITTVGAIDWANAFSAARGTVSKDVARYSRQAESRLADQLPEALGGWVDSDDSMGTLRDGLLGSKVDEELDLVVGHVQRTVRETLAGPDAGAQLQSEQVRALDRIGVTLSAVAAEPLAAFAEGESFPRPALDLGIDELPVKRGFFDFLFFRSAARVRALLLGDAPDYDRPIAQKQKRRRLNEASHAHLSERLKAFAQDGLGEGVLKGVEGQLTRYARELQDSIGATMKTLKPELDAERARLEADLASITELQGVLENLSGFVQDFDERLNDLGARSLPPAAEQAEDTAAAEAEPPDDAADAGSEHDDDSTR